MLKRICVAMLSALLIASNGPVYALAGLLTKGPEGNTGTLEKMIVASGTVAMDLNLNSLNGTKAAQSSLLRFDVVQNSFFTVLVFNNELRGPLPSSMELTPRDYPTLPSKLNGSYQHLIIESVPWGGPYDLVVRDGQTGFTFFNIEGHQFDYDADQHLLNIQTGRLLLSKEFASELGRSSAGGSVVGKISIAANMRAIEVSQIVDGEVRSEAMPALRTPESGSVPGPDVVVGDLSGLAQFGTSGTQVGLAVGTDSCNFGVENLHWFQLPDNDHPVIPQNLYRMSGGANNDDRFEQIGQSSVKHAFTALTNNICGLGCNGVGGANLGSGCSDPYSASLNSGPSLGSRAWINPYTGFYPRGDSATPPNTHTGHSHTGAGHRILVEMSDLNTTLNTGATYYAESQYVTAHEYAWCQSHAGQCNMNNNVSYRRYSVTGTTSFTFANVGATQRTKAAVTAWTGATFVGIEPAPGVDGVGTIAYKVTNPSPGVWHYEYALYNQNLDRAIQSFGIPMGAGINLSNVGFHAPPQQLGWTFDGTVNNAGYSSTPWVQSQDGGVMTWSSQSFAQNPNANAVRWGTLYNIRFDSDRPPTTVNATIGFLKTGSPITIQVQGPSAAAANVAVSGRLTRSGSGNGANNVQIVMTDPGGASRTALTSSLGYYSFDNVAPGVTYTFSISSKRFSFTPQQVPINDNISNLDFVIDPIGRGR